MPPPHPAIIGESLIVNEMHRLIRCVAPTNETVLIRGETGAGKELVAIAIHVHSKRAEGPFVPVNCGSIPSTLAQSELFGHVKGSYTGAREDRPGHFESAKEGTIFLDEISSMDLALQPALLRVLQSGEIRRVGDKSVRMTNARVVAATNEDLETCSREGTFRRDLYARLNVVCIDVPPLRDRKEDIPLLVRHFLERLAPEEGRQPPSLSRDARDALMAYHWPENIRELEHALKAAAIYAKGDTITREDLPIARPPSQSPSLAQIEPIRIVERKYILETVRRTGQVRLASEVLRVSRDKVHQALAEDTQPASSQSQPSQTLRQFLVAHALHALELAQGDHARAAEVLKISPSTLRRWQADPRRSDPT